MRIIYVTSSFPFGPGEAFIMPELAALQAQGHELRLVPLWPRGRLVHVDATRFLPFTVTAPLFSARIAVDFAVATVKHRNIVCHLGRLFSCATPKLAIKNLAMLPKAAWLGRLATEWHADHIHAFWASTVASMALAAAEMTDIPWSFTAHRFDIVENNLLRYKAERARFVRFVSLSGLQTSGLQGTALEAKAMVLHLGTDINNALPAVSPPNKPVIALCAATLTPVKAHMVLIRAMQELKSRSISLELWLAGEGELRNALQREVRARSLEDRIKFLGQLSHSVLMNLYASGAISIVVLASADLGRGLHEGIPVSLMEAMSFGIPVVATTTGGIPELLGGGAGVMVSSQDSTGMADVLQLLSQGRGLRQLLGRAGREQIRRAFSAPRIAAQMAEFFSNAVGARAPLR
jgi:colanic acid/amylovoran biosynthesis glycosyltransferase